MPEGVGVVGIFVRDQEEALQFYRDKLGFRVHTDVGGGRFRWLTVQHPDQPNFQLGLFQPGPPLHDAATAATLQGLVAQGAMPALILHVADCRATFAGFKANGVEVTQEPESRFGNIDAGFRDPSGNLWKMIETLAHKPAGGAR